MERWASILTLTFGTNGTAKLSAPRSGRTVPQRKFFGTHLLQTECTLGLLLADKRNISLELRQCIQFFSLTKTLLYKNKNIIKMNISLTKRLQNT